MNGPSCNQPKIKLLFEALSINMASRGKLRRNTKLWKFQKTGNNFRSSSIRTKSQIVRTEQDKDENKNANLDKIALFSKLLRHLHTHANQKWFVFLRANGNGTLKFRNVRFGAGLIIQRMVAHLSIKLIYFSRIHWKLVMQLDIKTLYHIS